MTPEAQATLLDPHGEQTEGRFLVNRDLEKVAVACAIRESDVAEVDDTARERVS